MYEFNSNGSIKPLKAEQNKKAERENKLQNQKCLMIKKDIVSSYSPKKCVLRLKISDAVMSNDFVDRIYKFFREKSETKTNLSKINEKEFEIEIGTSFRRCSECNNLIGKYREQMCGNIIEDQGTCTTERKTKEFSYEDYFD